MGFILSLWCLIPCDLVKSNNRSLKIDLLSTSSAVFSGANNYKQKEIDTKGMLCRSMQVWHTCCNGHLVSVLQELRDKPRAYMNVFFSQNASYMRLLNILLQVDFSTYGSFHSIY